MTDAERIDELEASLYGAEQKVDFLQAMLTELVEATQNTTDPKVLEVLGRIGHVRAKIIYRPITPETGEDPGKETA